MKNILLAIFSSLCVLQPQAQTKHTLTVDEIMQDQKWIGNSPSDIYWSTDGHLFFSWNPDKNISDSTYYITVKDTHPAKADYEMVRSSIDQHSGRQDITQTYIVFSRDGDIFLNDLKKNKTIQVTSTIESETSPVFVKDEIVYKSNQNLFAWNRLTGATRQISNFKKGNASGTEKKENLSKQEIWLKADQLNNFQVLRERRLKRDSTESARKRQSTQNEIRSIYLEERNLRSLVISPDGRYIIYELVKPATYKSTFIPEFVTESGFTEQKNGRPKVGIPDGVGQLFIWDIKRVTILSIKTGDLPGIRDLTDFEKEMIIADTAKNKITSRGIDATEVIWNEEGTYAVLELWAQDNKDRWITLLDPKTGKVSVLDRQRDEAWIAGPGIRRLNENSWLDEKTIWFQSEASGYSHLYTMNVATGKKEQLTNGDFEVSTAELSKDKKYFYVTTNQVHPGEQHFYRLKISDGSLVKLTTMTGQHITSLSPDEKTIAYLYSYTNKPPELFLQDNKLNARPRQITFQSQSEAFRTYNWRDPEIISFKARDGETVYARLYKPSVTDASRPAVIFVHGAGYLQNAHKWWSSYSREYMFHNLLADKGYTILDIDYRGSAGYGRNWRTGIYRHMGGKDLTDQVDGAKLLIAQYGINPLNIGIYGGSYGGFITLMAMFTEQETFAAGAALRSVTDWAHYNQGYTSNILNMPFLDSSSYKKSSPLYYAGGLKGALLMCHGMVDGNVHFQDIIRLTQRLIELKKENWELAVYPMEDHGFIEPSSWTDEYKRILKLFENNLHKH